MGSSQGVIAMPPSTATSESSTSAGPGSCPRVIPPGRPRHRIGKVGPSEASEASVPCFPMVARLAAATVDAAVRRVPCAVGELQPRAWPRLGPRVLSSVIENVRASADAAASSVVASGSRDRPAACPGFAAIVGVVIVMPPPADGGFRPASARRWPHFPLLASMPRVEQAPPLQVVVALVSGGAVIVRIRRRRSLVSGGPRGHGGVASASIAAMVVGER